MMVFKTMQSDMLHLNGKHIIATVPLPESEYDRFDVGPMFRCKLEDGTELSVFEDEIVEEERHADL